MAINMKLFGATATRGDLAVLNVKVRIALTRIAFVLERNHTGDDDRADIQVVREMVKELNEVFEESIGWTAE